MKKMGNTFKLSALSLCLLPVYGASLAADADVETLVKPDSSISAGVGNWSGDRPQQGMYDGMREKGAYGLLDADINKRDDSTGTWLKLRANNLGLESREIKAEYLRQGDMGVSLEYSRTPFNNPYAFSTRLQGIGSTTERVATTAGTNGNLSLGTQRDAFGAGFYKRFTSELDLNISFKNEDKTGTRAWGAGINPYFLVEPVNSTTRQLEATLNYTTKALQLSGGYYGSWYTNKNDLVTVYGATTPATTPTYLSQPLDNQAHQGFLNGGYNFTSTTRGTFKVAYTRATQNETLPTTGIPGLSFAGAPSSLNGAVNTTLLQLGLTSRPIKDLSLLASLRYYNVDDATPIYRFVQTNAACASGQCVDNTPLSYKTLTGKLEGTYRLPQGFSLTAGLDQSRQDRGMPVSNANGAGGTDTQRAVPFRYTLDETTYRVQVRRSMSETINGTLAYLYSDRTGSTYGSSAAGPAGAASNLINPINIANRTRNKVRMLFDWTPADNLTLQFTAEDAKDNYAYDHTYGVRDGSAQRYGVDANYVLNEMWTLNAWYSFDRNRANQLNSRNIALGSISNSNLEDVGHSFGMGMRGNATERLKLGGDLLWTRNTSKYRQSLNAAQTANFSGSLEPITNTLLRVKFFSQYALDKHSELRFDFIHERWKTNDWTWMFVNGSPFVYGTGNTDGTAVSAMPRQVSNYVGARYIYRFQ